VRQRIARRSVEKAYASVRNVTSPSSPVKRAKGSLLLVDNAV
jgi:hypothetical protein